MKSAADIVKDLEANPTALNLRMISAATGETPYRVKRRLIAAAVAGGMKPEDAAKRFAVTVTVARAACDLHKVAYPLPERKAINNPYTPNYKIIAAILREAVGGKLPHGKTVEIARQFKCSKQNVQQMRIRMEKNGVFAAAGLTK